MGVVERLYYEDSYLTEFEANALDISDGGTRVYLDRTAFYPASGGQPFDTGLLAGAPVIDVIDEGERIAHVVSQPLEKGPVAGSIDRARRFDHMQQHTGQHLLSAVIAAQAGLETIAFHLGREISTIDLATPSISDDTLVRIEAAVNEEAVRDRVVTVSYEEAGSASGLRKASEREGTLRIVTIEGLDRSACGGTHVRRTGEIGAILLRKTEKIRGSTRLEFVCGMRAIAAARADWRSLKSQADGFQERIAALERDRRKLASELSELRGRDLYARTAPSSDGIRRVLRRLDGIDETVRTEGQAFAASGRAIYAAIADKAVLIAVSADSGYNAGEVLKRFAEKGGGSPLLAQGAVSDPAALLATLELPV